MSVDNYKLSKNIQGTKKMYVSLTLTDDEYRILMRLVRKHNQENDRQLNQTQFCSKIIKDLLMEKSVDDDQSVGGTSNNNQDD